MRYLTWKAGPESSHVRAFVAVERLVALTVVVYASLIELLQTGGPVVGVPCRWKGRSRPSPHSGEQRLC